MRKILLVAVLFILNNSNAYCQPSEVDPDQIKFTILYNDTALNDLFIGDQGFSCLIEIGSKCYLFDAGNIESVLANNTKALGVDCSKSELIFISHLHADHICGSAGIINTCNSPILYLPSDFAINQTSRANTISDYTKK